MKHKVEIKLPLLYSISYRNLSLIQLDMFWLQRSTMVPPIAEENDITLYLKISHTPVTASVCLYLCFCWHIAASSI